MTTISPYLAQLVKPNQGEIFGATKPGSPPTWNNYGKRIKRYIHSQSFFNNYSPRGGTGYNRLKASERALAKKAKTFMGNWEDGGQEITNGQTNGRVARLWRQANNLLNDLQGDKPEIGRSYHKFKHPMYIAADMVKAKKWGGTYASVFAANASSASAAMRKFVKDVKRYIDAQVKQFGKALTKHMQKVAAYHQALVEEGRAEEAAKAKKEMEEAKKKERHEMKNIKLRQSKPPFINKAEGNSFREWVRAKYPEFAKQIKLSASGKYNNKYVRQAWAQHGIEFMRSPDGEPIYQRMSGKEAEQSAWTVDKPEPKPKKKKKSRRRKRRSSSSSSYTPSAPPMPVILPGEEDKMAKFKELAKKYWWAPVSVVGVLGLAFVVGSLNQDPLHDYISEI